ncbi:hypothetical protein AB0L62_33165 [Nocardia asteroides]
MSDTTAITVPEPELTEFLVVPARLRALTGVDAITGGEIRWGRVPSKES